MPKEVEQLKALARLMSGRATAAETLTLVSVFVRIDLKADRKKVINLARALANPGKPERGCKP